MVLHFLYAVAQRETRPWAYAQGQDWRHVHGVTFGTRLTNITRHLATRDVNAALAAVGAVVILATDGGDRENPEQLACAMQRLHLILSTADLADAIDALEWLRAACAGHSRHAASCG